VFPVRYELNFYILLRNSVFKPTPFFVEDEVPHIYMYIGLLISLWLFLFHIFLFAAQPKEFFLDGLKKLEQRSHKCVELRGYR
jgi:hypothetical protein